MGNIEIDTDWTDNITCPYCGGEWIDSWEFEEDEDTLYCDECDKEFTYQRNVEVNYSSQKIEQEG